MDAGGWEGVRKEKPGNEKVQVVDKAGKNFGGDCR